MRRIKNALCLWAEYIFEELTTVIFLILLLSFMTFEICNMYTLVQRYNSILEVSKYLNDVYFYQLGFRADSTYKEDKEWIESLIRSGYVEDVTPLNYFSGNGAEIEDGEWETIFAVYNISSSHEDPSRIIPIRTIDGAIIDTLSPNKIILDESANSRYEIGDSFEMWIQYISVEDEIKVEESIIPVEVVGFVSRDEMVIYTGHQPTDLSRVYSTVYNPLHSLETMIIGGYPSYYCIASSFKDGNKTINYSEITPQMLLITPEKGVDENAFLSELEEYGISSNEIVSYSQLKENYVKDHFEELRHCTMIIIIMVIITITTMLVVFIDWYTQKRSELAILTFCGATWTKSIVITVSPYIFSLFMGTVLGSILWNTYTFIVKSEMIIIKWYWYLLLFFVYGLLFGLGVMVYFCKYKKLVPADIYKTRE